MAKHLFKFYAGNIEHNSQEKALKVRGEYEKKLNDLSGELKKIQSAKKEHARLLKSQTMYEKQMKTLRSELNDMKKAKVKVKIKNIIRPNHGKIAVPKITQIYIKISPKKITKIIKIYSKNR